MRRAILIAAAPLLVGAPLGTGCADQIGEDLPPGAFTSGPIIHTFDDLGIDDTTGAPDDDGMVETGGDDDDDDDMMETGMESSSGEIMCEIPDGLSHEADIAPIWAESCQNNATCHVTGGTLPDLETDAFANLQTPAGQAPALQYVTAGDAENSYLVAKIEGRQADVGGLGGTMPQGGTLDPCDVMLIAAWVEQGAAQ